ncbi:hypothetical protein J5N97_025058 [Dioscorea zingiberensis]|uniref:Uncharacterized protein n=1 Tax=Dioscorea zingiberensis TaxID=325984 RepID=A0A9D5C7K6_9LILI|nr:hypothetical protein J5N97_025058 [Dioscorea zingiberensis]
MAYKFKVFGSAGVIGNPMDFARNVGIGIKDLLSVSTQGIVQSPSGLFTGIAQVNPRRVGEISTLCYTLCRELLPLHFMNMDGQQKGLDSGNKGLVNEFLEGLTGLLQSPIRGPENHGLPGVLSGIAMGTA